ncbi:DUF4238 domain-containing protein [Mesorhizobium sp. LjNodule214]|uniref:DUF4238 domain-containing protein n=1 Tax=Mesorhizobium sp. LjNodule214 TaxID=3342252 RepID=UPI003ED0A668
MPLDHFVSQVHLRNFYSADERGRLVAVKKDDLKKFYPWSENVCRRPDGSTNDYLREPRAIEAFLKRIEPNYNAALEAVRRREPDVDEIYVIAGFVAYVMSCSPTAMRIGTPHIAATVQSAAKILDAQGLLPPSPDALGKKSMTDLLGDGSVQIKIDEKYPQAIGISQIEGRVHIFGNAHWDVMFANPADGAFFTSDFPVALGPSYDDRVVSKTVPLAPDVAVCIHPKLRERGREPDFSFPGFRARFRRLKGNEIREVNRSLARAAETVVLFNRDAEWLVPFVRNNRNFRADSVVSQIPSPSGGSIIVARQEIVPYARPILPPS